MKAYQAVYITLRNNRQSEWLIAKLAAAGYEGFEETELQLNAFIPQQLYDAPVTLQIISELGLAFNTETILPVNWNSQWESEFHPVYVGEFCAVRAEFHQPVLNVTHEIVITPKMSFGTGHHATTFLMIKSMELIDFTGKKVLDFGCGTGILSILAEKLGAQKVIAIDNDELCIENSLENIKKNSCKKIEVTLLSDPGSLEIFDIILANINKNILLEQIPLMLQHLSAGGVLLLSGVLEADKVDFELMAAKNWFSITKISEKDGWVCMQLLKSAFFQ